jgi:hypothetical protein
MKARNFTKRSDCPSVKSNWDGKKIRIPLGYKILEGGILETGDMFLNYFNKWSPSSNNGYIKPSNLHYVRKIQ